MTRLTNPEGTKPSNSQHFEQIFSSDVIDRIYREVLVAIKDQIDWEKEFGINISPIDCVSEESLRGIPLLGAKVEVSASSSFAKVQHGLSANAPLNLRQQKLPVITISRDTFSLTEDIRLTFLCATGSNFAYSLMVHELIHVMQMTQISSIDLEDPEINKLKAVTAVASLAATAWQINYPGIQAELISALIFIYSLITLKNKKSPAYDPMVKVTMEIHAYFVQAMCPSIDLIGQYLSNPEALFDRIKTEYIDSNNIKFEKDKLEELKVFVIEMCKRFAILYSISENMQSTHFLIAKVIGGRQSEDRNFKYYLDKLDTTITAELAGRAVPEDPIKILIDKRTRVSQKVKDVARPYIAAALNNLGQ